MRLADTDRALVEQFTGAFVARLLAAGFEVRCRLTEQPRPELMLYYSRTDAAPHVLRQNVLAITILELSYLRLPVREIAELKADMAIEQFG